MKAIITSALTALLAFAMVFSFSAAGLTADKVPNGYEQEPIIEVEGVSYYFAGPPFLHDIPGHYWNVNGNHITGLHFNEGAMPSFWASSIEEGALLFKVDGIIGYNDGSMIPTQPGYVHWHELVPVDPSMPYDPDIGVFLKHTAVDHFYFEGGPHPENAHWVEPGIEYNFIPNVVYQSGDRVA
ncbi:MAG: hypothetical protein ACE5QF_04150 [Thermoplasmata archaeon]